MALQLGAPKPSETGKQQDENVFFALGNKRKEIKREEPVALPVLSSDSDEDLDDEEE